MIIPTMMDMPSAYLGRRCNIISIMIHEGGVTEKQLSEGLSMDVQKIRRILQTMEEEGDIFSLMCGKERTYFLNDREHWKQRWDESIGGLLGDTSHRQRIR